jgi:hypothetical protein
VIGKPRGEQLRERDGVLDEMAAARAGHDWRAVCFARDGMSADALPELQRAAHLRTLLDRWIAEYPRILAIDPMRARHHAEAIDDLRLMIEQQGYCLTEAGPGTSRARSARSS